MGGSSSKQKKSSSKKKKSGRSSASKRNSDGDTVPENKKQTMGKKDKKAKNVKIQDENSSEKSPSPKIKKSISFSEKSKTQIGTPPVYRKKSMCYPCDAKDLNFEELRTRSGSDKSLRFSDFNKLVRQTALYAWEMAPADIPLYDVTAPRLQSVCYICGVYTGNVTRACRVCYQVYHDGCLSKIGHALDKRSRHLAESNCWSCHQCSVLSHLLTREDVQKILSSLKELQMNPDGITVEDYFKYYENNILGPVEKSMPAGFKNACEARFKVFDKDNTGYVEFDEFLDLVVINVLQNRSQCTLVHVLTEPELTKARKLFLRLEEEGHGQITVETAYRAIKQFDNNIKEIYRPLEDCIANTEDEKRSMITWGSFVCTIAIHLLVQRPNYSLAMLPSVSKETLDKTQSFDSLDEVYKTCDSDMGMSLSHSGDRFEDQTEGKSEESGGSMLMLEELSSTLHFDKGSSTEKTDSTKHAQEERKAQLNKTSQPHLWNCHQTKYRHHSNFSQNVISFSNGDSNDTEEKNESKMDEEKRSSIPARGNRRSEILIRPGVKESSGKRRAVSQKVIAPSFGRLVDRVQQEDWC